ncbi:hypothetical protein KVR01_003060 [Diaporthe batatas]|uniref:uncharacterized protein n=1 Tax=Diaporthe batatas TaxID=748121 RepID=UPI001D05B487|nr:uncharacterized protein KVR01_003060 [Diaporthe batatas]KAG8167371.1 hypothetical protein KVR01_003060 [Diaporthe batatas]
METSLGLGLPLIISWFLYSVLLISIYVGATATYNLFFHPLRHYPGPKSWAATYLPWSLSVLRGHPHIDILELHKRYGDVVRLSPSELSFSHTDAWREIYGHLKRGEVENDKDPRLEAAGDQSIVSAPRERHGQMRRLLSHGFSARAMAEQQPLMDRYIDLFIRRLREKGQGGKARLDSTKWFEWTTFDIIGDLSFGVPFGCLQNAASHPWVETLFDSLGVVPIQQIIYNLPLYSVLKAFYFMLFVPRHIMTKRQTSQLFSEETLKKRMSLATDRPDYVDAMLRGEGEMKLTDIELRDNATLITTAGSETTASALTATIFLLGTHPDVLARLEAEVRSAFRKDQEINVNSVQNLPYMLAVLKESMRVHPPVAISIPRVTPPGGARIAGTHVAEGAIVGVWQYAAYHNPAKFRHPDSFIPERWLEDYQGFENDERGLCQHFSVGPRNCIGMNLAYAEMRLILARIIFNFDISLAPESRTWTSGQKLFFFWKKPPLWTYYKPRKEGTTS